MYRSLPRHDYAVAAQSDLRKTGRSYAFDLRLCIDQKMLDDALLLAVGIDIQALEFPRTE